MKPFQDRTLLATIKIAWSNYKKQQSTDLLSKADIERKLDISLTPQEYEILTKLINGESYKQIAEAQFLTTDSIKYHAGKIYKKLGISGRSELHSRLL